MMAFFFSFICASQSAQESQRNAEILQDRMKSELVKKHGDAAHEAQLKNKFETDLATLEKQVA